MQFFSQPACVHNHPEVDEITSFVRKICIIYTYIYVYIMGSVYIYVCMCIYIYTYRYVIVYVCIYIYTYTFTHIGSLEGHILPTPYLP